MTDVWVFIVTTVGTAATTLLGVAAGTVLTSRSQRNHWAHGRQADACAEVLRESSGLLIALAGATPGALQRPAAPGVVDWKPWNEALAGVALIADRQIVEAAHAIDKEFWNTHIALQRGLAAPEDWFALRDAIDRRREAFTAVARRCITHSSAGVQRLGGRPAPDDPIWDGHPAIRRDDEQAS
ncbi:hypothetical protein [Streptomyces sp. NPDC005989]|uniref:hypothetical protein n=1 Tax=Streptomyces sp. NPDC005989 TaxID=3156727 RepID=UPI0033CFCBDE